MINGLRKVYIECEVEGLNLTVIIFVLRPTQRAVLYYCDEKRLLVGSLSRVSVISCATPTSNQFEFIILIFENANNLEMIEV